MSVPDEGYSSNVPDEGYYSNVPDEGYYSNVPDEGYYSNVPDEGYYSNVPDEGYSRNASCALNLTSTFYYYHWVETSAGGQLIPESIIRHVVSVSALISGADPGFQIERGGVTQEKNAPSGGRRELLLGISCEKSRFYAKKIIFFPILGGGGGGSCIHPWIWFMFFFFSKFTVPKSCNY